MTRNLARDGLMEDGKEELLKLGRIRAACDLVSQYLPRDVHTTLKASYDFSALDAHLKSLQPSEVSIGQDASKEKDSMPAKEATKKRKGKGSQGVEKLKKANTEGMAKLSTFFKKK